MVDLAGFDKNYGKGSVMRMGDKPMDIEAVSTGILPLDVALGIGGFPRGRVIEIFGPESGGKSTIALHAVASYQQAGYNCLYVDAEHALNPEYMETLGVDVDDLYVSQPMSSEKGLGIVSDAAESGEFGLIVLDSVAALSPEAEINGDIGDSHMGLQARLMGQALRKMTGNLNTTHTTCVFINQIREKIGVMFGSNETTPGGRALKFYSSVRLDVRKYDPAIKDGIEIVGNKVRVKVVKNKVAPPFKQAELVLMYGHGISVENSLFDLAVDCGFLEKSGNWFEYGGTKLNGKGAWCKHLSENPSVFLDLDEKVRSELF